jgi:hypothetical protein
MATAEHVPIVDFMCYATWLIIGVCKHVAHNP